MMSLRQRLGALIYDAPRYLRAIRGNRWIEMHNRNERITRDGRGVRCEWEFTSDLHIAKVFPSTGSRLLRIALEQWPIELRRAPEAASSAPDVAFVIGHRGSERLPLLLVTLQSIAAQRGVSVECIVVEQDAEPRIKDALPDWVRYEFQQADGPYNRAATLNAGARIARAPLVILHDNDMLVPESYAAECASRCEDGAEFVEIKRFIFYLSEQSTAAVIASGDLRLPGAIFTIVQNAMGASIAARRDSYFRAGGFDEAFVGWGGEDNEFWERAEAVGQVYRFGYLPLLHLYHAPQKEKGDPNAPAVRRYHEIRHIPPLERVKRLTDAQTREG
jgi:hypothetical protein